MRFKPRNLLRRHFGSRMRRRRAWHRFLNHKAQDHDLALYRSHLNWLLPGPFQDVARDWGKIPGVPLDRCYLLFAAGKYLQQRGLDGASADCGVRHGKTSYFLLRGLDDRRRAHHIFDSFAGLSEPGELDRAQTGETGQWQAHDLAVAEEEVAKNLADFPNCHFHAGWIPERFSDVEDEEFAFVHVDLDLHQPTRDTLEFFHPRLVAGGLLVCDDHGFASCPGPRKAVDDFFEDKPEGVLSLPTGQCLVIKI